jgi:hypothetical protein
MITSIPPNQDTAKMVRITGEIPTSYAARVKHYCIDAKQDIKDFVGNAVKAYIDTIAPAKFPAGNVAAASVAIQQESSEIASLAPAPEDQNSQDQLVEAKAKTILCEYCQSKNVKARGTRKGRHRYQCKDCVKYFSI